MEKNTYTIDAFSTEEAFEVADFVIEGRIHQLGIDNPAGGGQIQYQGTIIDILKFEKGNYSESPVVVDYLVSSFKNGQLAQKPAQGKEYRFYIFIQRDRNIFKKTYSQRDEITREQN